MRWKEEMHFIGDRRIVRRFLWLPVTLDGETRWLEWATIEQEYYCGWSGSCWEDKHWIYGYL